MCSQKWLRVSFNIDILSGPWSIGHVFSKMVRLTNLDRAIGMVQSGTLCHVWCFFDFRCEQINDYQFDDQVQRYRGCQRSCQEWLSQKKPTETDNRISGMAARRRFVTANGIRANVQNPRLSDQTIIIRLHKHGFGSRRSMKDKGPIDNN